MRTRRGLLFALLVVGATLFLASPSDVGATTIETIVGGSNGDGYPKEVAKISPSYLAFDGSDNLYIADQWDHRIRRIDAQSAITSSIAGVGQFGFNGEGILATLAKMASPTGVAVDSAGNVYFADQLNQRIRRIDRVTKLITTVAGTGNTSNNGDGYGLLTNVAYPAGLHFGPQGLIFAESSGQRVRVLDSQGYVRTVAGSGAMGFAGDGGSALAAKLGNPADAISDSAGNLYIADKANCRVRKVDLEGIIRTVAGVPEGTSLPCGRTGDGGQANQAKLYAPSALALDPSERYLYIVDSLSVVIRRVDLQTGIITHVAGTGFPGSGGDGGPAAQAQLGSPVGIAFDSKGDLYVSDNNLNSVRRIDREGIIRSVVGYDIGDGMPADVTRTSPKGIALDASGQLHITDAIGNRSRRIDRDNRAATVAGTGDFGFFGDGGSAANADLAYPMAVATDQNGRVCVSDQLNHRVRCISPTGVITTLAGTGVAMFNGDGSAAAASLNYPSGLAFDIDNSLYVADTSNHRIRRIKDGTITTVVGSGNFWFNGEGLAPLSTNLNTPTDIVIDDARNLYFSEKSSCRIRKFDVASNAVITIAGTGTCGSLGDGGLAKDARVNGPEFLALHPSGILYFTESAAPRVRQIDLATGIVTRLAGTGASGYSGDGGSAAAAQLMHPSGMLVDPTATYLYIADFDAGNVRRVTLDGGGGGAQPTPTNSPLPPTSTATPTFTATPTPVPPTSTRTATITPTFTRTSTATVTPVLTSTRTNTAQPTSTWTLPPHTATPTLVPNTATPTDVPDTVEPTSTRTPIPPSSTRTETRTPEPTAVFTGTFTPTSTRTETPEPTSTRTRTPTLEPAATLTRTPTRASTATTTRTQTRTRTPTTTSTLTRTRTATRTATVKATPTNAPASPTQGSATPTRTQTRAATATLTRTPTRPNTATTTRTQTRTRTPTQTLTATRTRTATRTSTNKPFTATPTEPAGPTATRTETPEAATLATATRTAAPGTSTRTATRTVTPTRTRTSTITRTATRTLTSTRTPIQPTATRTSILPTSTPTQPPTSTPTIDPLRSSANTGPQVTRLGIASSSGVVQQPNTYENNVPVYVRDSGWDFYLVLEAKRGSGGATIGRFVTRSNAAPDLQMQVGQQVGNGNAAVCDASGGVPATVPLDFSNSSSVIDVLNDFTCKFTSTNSPSLAVTFDGPNRAFMTEETQVQFSYKVEVARAFLKGDTTITGRVLDINGNPGPIDQIIIRVP